MSRKKCKSCGEPKALDEFYEAKGTKDGRMGKCKKCKDAANKRWDKEHPEARARIRKKHQGSEKSRKYQKEWRKNNREKCRVYERNSYYRHHEAELERSKRHREYQKQWVKKNKSKVRSYLQKWQSENYEKHLAHVAVKNAVKAGKLPSVKNLKCSECGKPAVNYHHHRGYTKEHQLDVIPVCATCHKRLDKATS